MMKTAWVFPGQGSQTVGMGVELKDNHTAKEKFAIAQSILGWSVLEVCQGDETTLSSTLYTQPCLYVIESILAELLIDKIGLPQLVAGHSLGEYVALYVARVFDFASGLRLVKKRSELMANAAGGKMAALMKFDRQQLETAIANTPDVVLANDNGTDQVVISGTPEAVETIMNQVKAKRAVLLNVSGAFHSPLMQSASDQFQSKLEAVSFANAKIPVLSNVEPIATTDGKILKERLLKQMTSSVRWRELMLQLPAEEIEQVIEVGPGKVLTGLLKRTCKGMNLQNLSNLTELNAWADSLDNSNDSVTSLNLAIS